MGGGVFIFRFVFFSGLEYDEIEQMGGGGGCALNADA